MGVTVANPDDLTAAPRMSGTLDAPPTELEVTDLVVGAGLEAPVDGTVAVRYRAVRADTGAEVESTWSTGGTTTQFPLRSVIEGFRHGIPGMREGGRRVLVVPPRQGFGVEGIPPTVPSGVHLVYVVDLVQVV